MKGDYLKAMLVTISVSRNSNFDTVTIERLDGRKIVSQLDDRENIRVIENTTNMKDSVAECAAGICLINFQEKGNDTIGWRDLVDQASRCRSSIDEYVRNLN